jgi:hypothetical protein
MKYFFLILLIVFLTSCTKIEKKEKVKPTVLEYFDIDTSMHHVNERLCKCFQDSIDSYLEIRFSTRGTFLQPNKYLLLKYDGKKWKGIIGTRSMLVGEKSSQKYTTPKIGWEKFQDSLVDIDINSLVFFDSEKDSLENTVIDGETLYMEIITPSQYKIYNYHEPNYWIGKIKKSNSLKKFERIFDLINYNFNNLYKEKR